MSIPHPELPQPAHLDRDSALGRKFGREVTNYFGGEFEISSRCGVRFGHVIRAQEEQKMNYIAIIIRVDGEEN